MITKKHVRHDWVMRVYGWMGFPQKVLMLTEALMNRWSTKIEIYDGEKRCTSRLIRFNRGFLQGDSYSAVGFCLSEVPVCIFLADSKVCCMGPPNEREVKKTHSLFIDDQGIPRKS